MTDLLSSLAVLVFAVSSMLSVGFSYTVRQILEPLRNARGVIRALVANFALVPLLAFAVVQALRPNRPLEVGLILIATAAGAPFLIKLAEAAEGDLAIAATLLVLLPPVTVVYMPIVVRLAVPDAAVSAGAVARPLVLTMLLLRRAGKLDLDEAVRLVPAGEALGASTAAAVAQASAWLGPHG
ncbi:MAG TPA: transporter, partial [Thermodesulfobacteriota bacterium]